MFEDFSFRSFSMRNLNLRGLMKLSRSSSFRSSIPATASNPQGFPSTFVNRCTSTAGLDSSSFALPVFGGVFPTHPQRGLAFPDGGGLPVPSFSSKDCIMLDAFSTHACISVRDFSRSSREPHFQSLFIVSRNSLEFVSVWKKASKPVLFGEVGINLKII